MEMFGNDGYKQFTWNMRWARDARFAKGSIGAGIMLFMVGDL
jgi:hypothetical protein